MGFAPVDCSLWPLERVSIGIIESQQKSVTYQRMWRSIGVGCSINCGRESLNTAQTHTFHHDTIDSSNRCQRLWRWHIFYDNTIAFAICLGKTEKGRRAQYWHRAQLFCMELEKLAIWESHFNMQSVAFFILSWVVFLKWPLASSQRLENLKTGPSLA